MGGLQVTYRPNNFKTFRGNQDVVTSLEAVLKRKNTPSAFLLTGESGCGKTTLGRIIAKELKCHKQELRELNAANDRGIDAIRLIIDKMQLAPLNGDKKVFFLDEAHMLTKPSQEALLKALEEPPSFVHFIICTTNPEALKTTFKRRCHNYELSPLTDTEMLDLLNYITKKEKVKQLKDSVSDKIIELSEGSAGKALKYLDMVIDITGKDRVKRAKEVLKSAGTAESEIIDICRALIKNGMTSDTRWSILRKILKNYRGDGESARRAILGYMSAVALNKNLDEAATAALIMEEFKGNYFDTGKSGLVMSCINACVVTEEPDDE